MLVTEDEKDENWCDFLQHYDLWDERMMEQDSYLRYRKFSAIEFPETPHH